MTLECGYLMGTEQGSQHHGNNVHGVKAKSKLWCNCLGVNSGSSLISRERAEAVVGNFLSKSCLQTLMVSPTGQS